MNENHMIKVVDKKKKNLTKNTGVKTDEKKADGDKKGEDNGWC
jgi:hypothetical protein